MKPRITIHGLPFELLFAVMKMLAPVSLVEESLDEVPSAAFDEAGHFSRPDMPPDLKNASLVCQGWRETVKPLLFERLRLVITQPFRYSPLNNPAPVELDDFLRFVDSRDPRTKTLSITIITLKREREENPQMVGSINQLAQSFSAPVADVFGRAFTLLSDVWHLGHWEDAVPHDPLDLLWAKMHHLQLERLTVIGHGSSLAAYLRGYETPDPREIIGLRSQLRIFSLSCQNTIFCPLLAPSAVPLENIVRVAKWTNVHINHGSFFSSIFRRNLAYAPVNNLHVEPSLIETLQSIEVRDTVVQSNSTDEESWHTLWRNLTFNSMSYFAECKGLLNCLKEHWSSSDENPSIHQLRIRTLPKGHLTSFKRFMDSDDETARSERRKDLVRYYSGQLFNIPRTDGFWREFARQGGVSDVLVLDDLTDHPQAWKRLSRRVRVPRTRLAPGRPGIIARIPQQGTDSHSP